MAIMLERKDIPIPLALRPAGNPDSWNSIFRIMGCIVMLVCLVLVVFKKDRKVGEEVVRV